MSKRKIFLASIVTTAALTMVGCSSGGGSSSSSVVSSTGGDDVTPTPTVTSTGTASYVYNTTTDLRVDGVPFYEVASDATGDAPPSVPVIRR